MKKMVWREHRVEHRDTPSGNQDLFLSFAHRNSQCMHLYSDSMM